MEPTHQQIEAAAFERCRRRDGGFIRDIRDWREAELDLLFRMNYDLRVNYKIEISKKQVIGDRQPRKCRYCERSSETTFKHKSHAIPEAFGFKTLISLDECDRCNDLFSRTFEHDFDNLTRPMRTLFHIKGKTIPSYKTRDKRGRIDHDPQNKRMVIREEAENVMTTHDPENKRLDFALGCQPYKPMGVYQCLVKMALAIMPETELRHFDTARRWILDTTAEAPALTEDWAWADFYHSPAPFAPTATLHRRRSRYALMPYMLFMVGSAGAAFQIAVPFSPKDSHLIGSGRMPIPRLDLPMHRNQLHTSWVRMDLSSNELKRDHVQRASYTYETSEEITEEEFRIPTRMKKDI